uniref:Uncharacterized protein n=1 Tax=Candidatus Kentrum sp. UNK TaxID=2126344 RepID=A0A451B139_9GAMM|nr:MAG: hypothetical protein BECKUNK1418G_GA0071005_108910 [Candidatus Kentron sp. UNK]VFK71995.1 MAG: hypothetical protein BECKUNK1418H_GA0071006_109010 [Candidatus Kentron sp. UNK]
MKDSKPARNLVAPTIKPNESRQRMRNIENLLNTASNAIQSAKEEYHYLIYGTEGSTQEKKN